MGLRLITAPAEQPVTLAECRQILRIDHGDDDAMIEALIRAAVTHLDGWGGILGRCIIAQEWELTLDRFPACEIRLPFPGVSSVTVKYSDTDDVEQTLDAGTYQLLEDARGSAVRWRDSFAAPALYSDRADAVRVNLVAGYGPSADDVPEALKLAIKMHVRMHYDADGEKLRTAFDSLVHPLRRITL